MDENLILSGLLFALTAGSAIQYYRQLRRVQKEYEKAREAVEDIVLSFNRQLKHATERVELVAYKIEATSSKSDKALIEAEEARKKIHDFDTRIGTLAEDRENTAKRLEEIAKQLRDVITSQEVAAARISSAEEQTRKFLALPESKIEAAIPIKREKALAPLTETELSVLQMLASEGTKTPPEIKQRIELSREHTARLMKKLYEGGYLERDASKIPFKYSVKKEMGDILKKKESETETA
jgi:chromosome segregation ATPase